MFWADRIAKEIEERFGKKTPLIIRDEKTLSGRVHVGSMRGAAIHGTVAEVLGGAGVPATFRWEHNDFDVFDTAPEYLPKEFQQYVGMLVKDVPSPEEGYKNFAEYYGKEFQKVIEGGGWQPEFYWGSEVYESGKMDGVIREALERAEDIRRIYKEVSGSHKEEGWLPLSVICEQCKKAATTEAKHFNGQTVEYACSACGKQGSVSPFGGRAKLQWKVEWPAKWKVHSVSVEGGGKDHSTKGGARDVANHIAKEVFNIEPPFDIPYEFFLVGGRKMSSSKGRGSSAKEISDLVPEKIFRLALLGKDINQAINFDPEGDTIPTLYDQYDKLAQNYWSGTKDDYARLFELIHSASAEDPSIGSGRRDDTSLARVRDLPPSQQLPRFSQVAFVVQMPHMDLRQEFPHADKAELQERAAYAKKWLEAYAPQKYVFKLQEKMPSVELAAEQKNALAALADYVEGEGMLDGEKLHHRLHEIKEEQQIAPAEFFSGIYLIFLAKRQGPQAGWFLASLGKEFVLKRLHEALE